MSLSQPLLLELAALGIFLLVGSVVRLIALRGASAEVARERRASLLTWWALFLLLATAVLVGPLGVCVLLMLASSLALAEFTKLVGAGTSSTDRPAIVVLFVLTVALYAAIYLGHGRRALLALPFVTLAAVSVTRVVQGAVDDFLSKTGVLVLGAVLLLFGPAHAALLLALPESSELRADSVGWFIFLIVLTELNDISQALVGRRFGRRKITPVVSPNKTWEGLLGGLTVTCVAANLLAPHLTNLTRAPLASPYGAWVWPTAAAFVISIAGFFGDLTLSSIKRDVGVKDSSDLLPGMGGVLDRIDSLTLSAPCFYWLLHGLVL